MTGQERSVPKSRAPMLKVLGVAAVIGSVVVLARFVDVRGVIGDVMERIEGLGFLGVLAFIGLYVVACIFFLPGSVLTLGAGAIYGLFRGTLLVSAASMAGATVAFLIGRYLAREWVGNKIAGNAKFKAIDEAVAREGWKIVGLIRLSPAFPFSLLNYAFGVTRVSFRDYFFASWIGMLPGTIMYVYLGSLAGSLAGAGAEQGSEGMAKRVTFAVGLAATIAVTLFVTRMARNALRDRVESDSDSAA